MGLGPPVCTKCKVFLKFKDADKTYMCPICQYEYENLYDPLKPNHLWELTKEEQEEYRANTKNIMRKTNNG